MATSRYRPTTQPQPESGEAEKPNETHRRPPIAIAEQYACRSIRRSRVASSARSARRARTRRDIGVDLNSFFRTLESARLRERRACASRRAGFERRIDRQRARRNSRAAADGFADCSAEHADVHVGRTDRAGCSRMAASNAACAQSRWPSVGARGAEQVLRARVVRLRRRRPDARPPPRLRFVHAGTARSRGSSAAPAGRETARPARRRAAPGARRRRRRRATDASCSAGARVVGRQPQRLGRRLERALDVAGRRPARATARCGRRVGRLAVGDSPAATSRSRRACLPAPPAASDRPDSAAAFRLFSVTARRNASYASAKACGLAAPSARATSSRRRSRASSAARTAGGWLAAERADRRGVVVAGSGRRCRAAPSTRAPCGRRSGSARRAP